MGHEEEEEALYFGLKRLRRLLEPASSREPLRRQPGGRGGASGHNCEHGETRARRRAQAIFHRVTLRSIYEFVVGMQAGRRVRWRVI